MRTTTVLLFLALLAGCAEDPPPEPREIPPSFLLITLDTTRADHLGCYGRSPSPTPTLDSFAAQGARFSDALSPVPLTLPSHATVLTGLSARSHAVRDNELFRLAGDQTTLAEILGEAGYRTAAFVSSDVLDRQAGLDQGFDLYDDRIRIGERRAFNYEQRAASQVTPPAVAFLREVEPPFFVWVHYFDPHAPYVPPEPFRSRFPDRPYDAEIAFADAGVSHLLQALDERGIAKQTVVVVAGDHGESLGEHGEAIHGVFLYDATQRVPLIMRGPGIPPGAVVEEPVGLIDLLPTILELLGRPAQGEGRSLVPLFAGGEAEGPSTYELETLYPTYKYGWAPLRGIVDGPWKYIDAPRRELYDRRADPGEVRNLADSMPDIANRLKKELAFMTGGETGIPSPPPADPVLGERRERLEALGYISGNPAGTTANGPRLDPKDVIDLVDRLDRARELLQRGRPAEGIPLLREVLERNPDNVMALLALGSSLGATGDTDGAVAMARRALDLNPEYDVAWQKLGIALGTRAIGARMAGKPPDLEAEEEARVAFERALDLNPRYAEAFLAYGRFERELGRPEEARDVFFRGRGAGIEDPELETELGVLEEMLGNRDAAAEAYRRAVDLNPRSEAATHLDRLRHLDDPEP